MATIETENKIDQIFDVLKTFEKDSEEYKEKYKEFLNLCDTAEKEEEIFLKAEELMNCNISESFLNTKKEDIRKKIKESLPDISDKEMDDMDGNFILNLWYNDMFGWAYSHCMTIIFNVKSRESAIDQLYKWLDKEEVKNAFKMFEYVSYPEKNENGSYKEGHVEKYFHLNCIVGHFIEKLINEFVGWEIENSFKDYLKDITEKNHSAHNKLRILI